MNDKESLSAFIEGRLSWELSCYDDINVSGLADSLAYGLKNNGYCADPHVEYDKALTCPINKRHEKHCNCAGCPSYEFCQMLRKEGYV